MDRIEHKITLGLHAMSSSVSLNLNQGETAARIIASFTEYGMPYEIADDCYAVFSGKKPDGYILFNKCTIEGNTVIYDITYQTVAAVGNVAAQIRLYGAGGKLICSPDFTLVVDANTVEDDEVVEASGNEITALTELLTELQALKQELEDLIGDGGSSDDGSGSGSSSGSSVTLGEVTLLAANWVGDEDPYSQVVEIDGVTATSQVDLKPSVEQLAIFHDKDLAFVTENEDGVVTVYAIGQKPENDYTMQVSITEVSV